MPTQIKKKQKPRIPPLTIQNARLIYKNFSGAAKTFNAKGLRNFHVVLDPDQAKMLEKDGWNIKWPKPRDDGEERNPTLKVAVRFENFPPYAAIITQSGRKVELDEDSIGTLDSAEIETVDLKITGSYYEMEGRSGFKAYLNQIFVTLSKTDLMGKYADIPSGRSPSDD
jgi:hypothetical protein